MKLEVFLGCMVTKRIGAGLLNYFIVIKGFPLDAVRGWSLIVKRDDELKKNKRCALGAFAVNIYFHNDKRGLADHPEHSEGSLIGMLKIPHIVGNDASHRIASASPRNGQKRIAQLSY